MTELPITNSLSHTAVWENDCQGKKDFDADFVSVSTRYWPAYQTIFDMQSPEKGLHEIPVKGPSATSSILLNTIGGEPVVFATRDFEGRTEEEVKERVEIWVSVQFAKVVKALMAEFEYDDEQ